MHCVQNSDFGCGLPAALGKDAETFCTTATALARDIVEMVYKEEKILFPLETLTEEEWIEVRRGEDELGYELVKPAAAWPEHGSVEAASTSTADGLLGLMPADIPHAVHAPGRFKMLLAMIREVAN